MLLIVERCNPEIHPLITQVDSVFEFESEEAAQAWVTKFQNVTQQGHFRFTFLDKSEPPKLPSYDDPTSVWERVDYVRLVQRILNSRILCWHCDSDKITVLSDGWLCENCSQHGRHPNEIMLDREAGMFNNCLYREFTLNNAQKAWDFARPYVCVWHRPTGKGYYLNRNYGLIATVKDIVIPVYDGGSTNPELPHTLTRCLPHETMEAQSGGAIPDWAEGLPCTEFTSFWLY